MGVRLAWATDIHLDHCGADTIQTFMAEIAAQQPDALALTGDLSDGLQLQGHLEQIANDLQIPVYFILGNHDYYESSIVQVRQEMRQLSQNHPFLRWLPSGEVFALSEQSCIVGHGGWGDGRNGDLKNSWLKLTDFRLIQELALAGEAGREALLHHLGDEGAAHLQAVLPAALAQYQQTIVLVHAPPYREACLYGAEMADDNWAPHFTCRAIGDLLQQIEIQPWQQVTVLAGHTHNICELDYRAGLKIRVGTAEYGQPRLADLLILP